ncbi:MULTISPECIES: TonB-dependent receptor [Altibacter]|uniref:TonB-dependent receptor domain-containing protein n=1 Tax=Altibacter TaxID=1535231 RepID=UPI000552CE4A|nr:MULTISPECIES: TonB-dependent receptor [Altibacter]MCW8981899.1 TonB-dependent receptor [Altibacter sp.]MCW9037992.1 TonB-dependent receptor [Altibacter sp.]
MKKIFALLLLVATATVFSQRAENNGPVTVSGKIIEDGTNIPLEYATVAFIDQNKNIVTGGITDIDGNYAIDVAPGVYTVQFEFISYKTKQLPNQRLFEDTTLPTMTLAVDAASLDEVVIRAETTEVQVRLDKKIYNIGKDLTTSGATVSDALNNVPSVNVDVEGAISLRGNENVRILINGKPSAIAGFGSTDALRQLPAESIERVEVITSPSARYDAEGTAGIINIILRKEKTLGLNGSIQTNLGIPISSGITGNINLRTDKFNIFNTTGIRYSDAPGNAYFENLYFSDTRENPLVIEDRDYDRLRKGFNTNLGFEYFLTDNSSITATGFLRTGDNEDVTTNITNEFNRSNALAVSRTRIETETEEDESYQFSLNYVNNFSEDGHKLTADFQYENDTETEKSFIEERNTFPVSQELSAEDITTVEDQQEYLAQIDYVLPIGENAQFEAGYRGNFEETVTDYLLLEEVGTSGSFVRNDSLSNIFTYNENVHALYSQYGNKFGKFSFLLGLRMENTQLKGKVDAEDVGGSGNDDLNINFDKNYTGLFPTVNLIYELGESENVTLGYNRRINRPRSWFINPFPSRSSEANVFQGNPNLDPAYASAFDLGYLKRWGKFTLTSSIYYQYETDSFERIQEDTGELTPNGIPIIRTIPINLSTNQRYGFEAGALYNPLKWLRLNGSFNFFKFVTDGAFNGVDYGAENTSWFARGSAKVTLPAKIDWQTNAFYRGPSNNAQTETEGLLSVDLALSKDIINDNATLAFNVSDLFNTRKRQSLTETETFRSYSEFQWRQRQFTFSFTYRFNEQKKRQRGRGDGNGGDDDFDFEG